jgi:hypothetical protein
MANYLFVYHGGSNPETPEEGAAVMKAWTDWFTVLGPAVVDGGNPAGPTKVLGADGSVRDGGPDAPSGYSVIAAASLDAAVEIARGCPVLTDPSASVEVVETLEVM